MLFAIPKLLFATPNGEKPCAIETSLWKTDWKEPS